MAAKVLIATGEQVPVIDTDGPAVGWKIVGEIDSRRETEVWNLVQTMIGLRSASSPASVGFYIDGDPTNPWIQLAGSRDARVSIGSFWLAIDVHGDGATYLVARRQAHLGQLTRRQPDPHPGLVVKPIFVGVKLSLEKGLGLFRKVNSSKRT